jgi:hypothetical protein
VSRKWIITVSTIGGVVLILIVMALSIPDNPLQSEGDSHTLTLGPITVPVASPEPAAEDPNQYLGVPHTDPTFDTSSLGTDFNLTAGTPNFAAIEDELVVRPDRIVRAVYLGDDYEGTPLYIYSEGSTNIGNLIAQFFLDEGTLFRFGTTYNCCIAGPVGVGVVGEPVLSISNPHEEGLDATIIAEWHDLPEEISVVALEIDSRPVGWQTPVSGTAALRITVPDDALSWETTVTDTGREVQDLTSTITLIAYNAQGEERARS